MSDKSENNTIQTKAKNKKGKREPTSLHVDPELWQEVRVMAVLKNKSVTQYFEEALRQKLDDDSKDMKFPVGHGGMYIPPPPSSSSINHQKQKTEEQQPQLLSKQLSQQELSKIIKENASSKTNRLHFVGPATMDNDGYGKGELILFLPGLNFPVNKNELIQYLKRVEKEKKVDTIPLLLNILEKSPSSENKVYYDKDRLAEDIVKTINANKEIKIGNRLIKQLGNSQIIGCLIGTGKGTNEPKLEEFLKDLV